MSAPYDTPTTELMGMIQEQRSQLEAQAKRLAELEIELRRQKTDSNEPVVDCAVEPESGGNKQRISRAGLLKVAAAGAAGVAGATLAGSLGAGEALADDQGRAQAYAAYGADASVNPQATYGFLTGQYSAFNSGVLAYGKFSGVEGHSTATGQGVLGSDSAGNPGSLPQCGVFGVGYTGSGVVGWSSGTINSGNTSPGVLGKSVDINNNLAGSDGVSGVSGSGNGVHGTSTSGVGVRGDCGGSGVAGFGSPGVQGVAAGATPLPGTTKVGVYGTGSGGSNVGGIGVKGVGDTAEGVYGQSTSGAGVHGVSASGTGVSGEAKNTANPGVYGYDNSGGAGKGVWGYSPSGSGAEGQSGTGIGVLGYSSSNGTGPNPGATGVVGFGDKYGGAFQGALAPLYLIPHPASGAPTTGTHQQGEIVVDNTGQMYVCTASSTGAGSAGTWAKVQYSGPTATRVVRFTARRQGDQVLFTWRMADDRGVAGFDLYAGDRQLNRRTIPVRLGRVYRHRVRWSGSGPFALRVLLRNGQYAIVTPT